MHASAFALAVVLIAPASFADEVKTPAAPTDAPAAAKPSASLQLTTGGKALAITGSVMFYAAYSISVFTAAFVPLLSLIGTTNLVPLFALLLPGIGPMLSWTWFTLSGGVPTGQITGLLAGDALAQLGGIAMILIARFEFREPADVSLAPLAIPGGGGARVAIAF